MHMRAHTHSHNVLHEFYRESQRSPAASPNTNPVARSSMRTFRLMVVVEMYVCRSKLFQEG